jgi:hypothetical protein
LFVVVTGFLLSAKSIRGVAILIPEVTGIAAGMGSAG